MELNTSILGAVKKGLGISETDAFDGELLIHLNSALSKLNQNGVGKAIMVEDSSVTWADFQDPDQNNLHFAFVPQFVTLSCKVFFDPPPPSMVEYYNRAIDEILWRLRTAYE